MNLDQPTNLKGWKRLFLKHIYEAVGETQRTLSPLEYSAIATKIGLDEKKIASVIRLLRDEQLITYPNQAVEAFRLTKRGIEEGEYLKFRNNYPLLNDPMPDSLEDVHNELAYWSEERFKFDSRSQEWHSISSRMELLKHREIIMTQQEAKQTFISKVVWAQGLTFRVLTILSITQR